MATKKDLAAHYKININTVIKTIEACGLSTAATSYSELEVKRFHEARQQRSEGASYSQISEIMNQGRPTNQVPEPNAAGQGEAQGQESILDLDMMAFNATSEAVAQSARKARKAIPALFQYHLARELQTNEFQESILDMNLQMNPQETDEEQNLFLLRGLTMGGMLPAQEPILLLGSTTSQQASLPQSDDY